MSFTITDPALQTLIRGAYNQQQWQLAYQYVIEALTDTVTDPSTGMLTRDPKVGVDLAALTWIEGAQQVNAGTGPFAAYIRDYTSIQYQLRTGQTLDSSAIQVVSNQIAANFLNTLINTNTWTVPSLQDIGAIDAAAAAAGIFKATTSDGAPNFSP